MMKKFDGFPDGDLRSLPVPDLLFTGLVRDIDHLGELKLVLHLIWLRQRQGQTAVSYAQMASDETLARSLANLGEDGERCLKESLARSVERGSLLHLTVDSRAGCQEIYCLNSEGGRLAMDQIRSGELVVPSGPQAESPSVDERPNIFQLYEENIGLLSPILADELRDAEASYPAEWIEEAFHIAAANNVRKWRYIQAILERWATQGKDDGSSRKDREEPKRWYTDEEFEQFFLH
jgi:DnaD/phage-associated family protein